MRGFLFILPTLFCISSIAFAKLLTARQLKTLGISLASAWSIQSFAPASWADDKLRNLPNENLVKIVAEDIQKRQALITADFTRDIYNEKCQFQDEVSVYDLPQYIKGTKALFDASRSHVDLVGDVTVDPNNQAINFHFQEILAFKIPPFYPKVSLSGRVDFSLDSDRLIVYSREHWDQPVIDVLKTVTF